MFYIVERFQDLLRARAFRVRVAEVSRGSTEQEVRQAIGEPSKIILDTLEDGTEYLIWQYKGALGRRTHYRISFVEGKWSQAWTAHYPPGERASEAEDVQDGST